jgi:hypothetical protein
MSGPKSTKDCARRYLEHNGLAFALIHWGPSQKQFDSNLAGYTLGDKHVSNALPPGHPPIDASAQTKPRSRRKRWNPQAWARAAGQRTAPLRDYF